VHTGAVDWLLEYATPTYVLVNKYTAMRLHCRRRMFIGTAKPRFYSACRVALGRAFCRRTRYLRYNSKTSLFTRTYVGVAYSSNQSTARVCTQLALSDAGRYLAFPTIISQLHIYVHMRDFYTYSKMAISDAAKPPYYGDKKKPNDGYVRKPSIITERRRKYLEMHTV
jgi:hypothetical protein